MAYGGNLAIMRLASLSVGWVAINAARQSFLRRSLIPLLISARIFGSLASHDSSDV